MASRRQALILLLLSLLTIFSCTIKSSHAATGEIATYWGQNNGDGELNTTCDTGNYEVVNLAFLNVFGSGRKPDWNFAGHCDHGAMKHCYQLESEIKYCQSKGVKVLLSIGGAIGDYSLNSTKDAKEVAKYLYHNFLSGTKFGPLGTVALNGIEFDILKTDLYWDDLVKELHALRQQKWFYLYASPECPINPKIAHLDKAIKTGLFDYIFVQFYNNPGCQYSPGSSSPLEPLFQSWCDWIPLVPNSKLFLGVPAASAYDHDNPLPGYIPDDVMISQVLPFIKHASNYGGVMLWNRFLDNLTAYSGKIKPYVPKPDPLQSVTAFSDAKFECASAALNRVLPKFMAQ